jgi:hypothetical protein
VDVKYVRSYLAGQGTNGTVDHSYTVSASTATYTRTLEPGWNLVAGSDGTIFPSTIFGWIGNGYESTATVAAWKGYWCKVAAQQTVDIVTAPGPHTVTLAGGWNLIGNPMGVPAALDLPDGESAFAYDPVLGQYVSVLTLPPGLGAWVKANVGEKVTLTPSS